MSSSKKSSTSKKSAAARARRSNGAGRKHDRELIDTGTDKRYVRRDDKGRFRESDDVGRSLAQDVRKNAKTSVKAGQGDRGDRTHESTLRAWEKTYENRGK